MERKRLVEMTEYVKVGEEIERIFDEKGKEKQVSLTARYESWRSPELSPMFRIKATSYFENEEWSIPIIEFTKKVFYYDELGNLVELIKETVDRLKRELGEF